MFQNTEKVFADVIVRGRIYKSIFREFFFSIDLRVILMRGGKYFSYLMAAINCKKVPAPKIVDSPSP